MQRYGIALASLLVTLSLASGSRAADEPKGDEGLKSRLIGTWRLVSARYGGEVFEFPEGTTHIKHVTPTQFMWATYDRDGTVTRAAGGSYTLEGDSYRETPEYGIGEDYQGLKGSAQKFKCRIDGNRWHHDGMLSNGLTIEEVWERVERK